MGKAWDVTQGHRGLLTGRAILTLHKTIPFFQGHIPWQARAGRLLNQIGHMGIPDSNGTIEASGQDAVFIVALGDLTDRIDVAFKLD